MIGHKRLCDDLCDDQQLARMLNDESDHCKPDHFESDRNESDHRDADKILDHVESCAHCQQRLDELAANEFEWRKTAEVLSQAARVAADEGMEKTHAPFRIPQIDLSQPAWNESMAQQLLSPPSQPEMLGRIGRYDVERLIGSGGMGVVFKANDTELNRPVAIKLLAPYLASSGAARNRFAREARAAAAVVDEHVVAIHNVESDGEPPFLVMKYIAGDSLQMRLDRDGPLEVCDVLRVGMHTAKGLAAAHAQGLIHRDVKPSNILLDEGVQRALLTDFGLARTTDDASLTRGSFHPGTPHYMSPEQVRGEEIDARSDLFGLGCVLYALCTGHPPFRSETSYAVLRRITDDAAHPIREVNPEIPLWLDHIVMKLLAKSPEARFDSAEQVAELLEDCLAHVQQPNTIPLPKALAELASQQNRRPPIDKVLIAAGFFFSILFAGVLMVLEWNKGTLTIESDADDVPIRIVRDGDTVRRLTISRDGVTTRLKAGPYTIEFDGPVTEYDLSDDNVVLKRGKVVVAKVTLAEKHVIGDQRTDMPLTEERSIFEAVREFNHLHPRDGQGRPQPPLGVSEVIACLQWKLGNGEFSEDVIDGIVPIIYTRHRMVPAGWQFSGGLVRSRSEQGIVQTWEINLETNGLSRPISIRRVSLVPPAALRAQTEEMAADEEATDLSVAIDAFNAAYKQIDDVRQFDHPKSIHGTEQPPLGLDEVLAAIALWSARRDEAKVDDATFERLQRIARTHRLPSGCRFEVIPVIENSIGEWFYCWSIQIIVPQVANPGSTYAFTIRSQYLSKDLQNASAIHWGKPAFNGIQAGYRLIPSQRTYDIGQVVDVEFMYRSFAGNDVHVTLPDTLIYNKANMGTEVRFAPALDVQTKTGGGSIERVIDGRPVARKGKRIQFVTDADSEFPDEVGTKLVVEPGKTYRLSFEVPNIGTDSSGEILETGSSHFFETPPLEPKKVLPVYTGHWYMHWGSWSSKYRFPTESKPDPDFIDPFQIGVSLGPADARRIPAYYSSGLEVVKIAPNSPATAAGIEVGDILLSWQGNHIYGDDPENPFGSYSIPRNRLRESLKEYAKGRGLGSFNMKFDLLDHRTGEVIGIAPWFGQVAGGGPDKAKIIERMQERRRMRNQNVNNEPAGAIAPATSATADAPDM